jgi:UDP-glucose 4-epimerase
MQLTDRRVVVTGGAGFVGSHCAERLLADGNDVVIVDDCSSGQRAWIPDAAEVVDGDLYDERVAAHGIDGDTDLVIHCAANKAVDSDARRRQFERNLACTYNVLERAAEVDAGVAFTSSSTVYGEAPRPTPEDYGPAEPISEYAAAKLGEEGLCSTYGHSYDVQTWVFRFANVVGPRLQRGAVVPDFIAKLRADPTSLTILGDGRQEKSYMHIDDCVDAMVHVIEHADEPCNIYKLGTHTTTSVTDIADIVSDELGVEPDYEYTGGDRGWTGDVPKMRLAIDRLTALGWEPTVESDAAVRQCARELIDADAIAPADRD